MKEAMELLQTPEAENIERCEIIAAQLKEKVTLLTQIDEEILNLCDVSEIGVEIAESPKYRTEYQKRSEKSTSKQKPPKITMILIRM
jgi:stalled ribosome rescue protein Dom34